MNKIFNKILGGTFTVPEPKKEKRTMPITAAFDKDSHYLGQMNGSDAKAAFDKFPEATVLNIIPVRGKTKVVRK